MSLPVIEDEAERLASLRSIGILDTPSEPQFDELVELAAWTCHAPISAITLVDESRQWFKAESGIGISETPRNIAFCAHTIASGETLVVTDTHLDPRFRDNPFVVGDPEVRFYAGVPISVDDGHRIGTLCVLDTRPRTLFSDERRALEIIARQVAVRLHARRLEQASIAGPQPTPDTDS